MGGIHAPMRCPKCDTASPSRKHLYAHRNKGELVRESRLVNNRWCLMWVVPAHKKAVA